MSTLLEHRSKGMVGLGRRLSWTVVSLLMVLTLVDSSGSAYAQAAGRVQVLRGKIALEEVILYSLPDLEQDETLYVYVQGTSGNLDPFVALADASLDTKALEEDFITQVDQAIAAGQDPLVAMPQIVDDFFLIWDDDSGTGYAAAFEFVVPADGDYQLLLTHSLAHDTFGDYVLTVGLDAPQVLSGEAEATGHTIAILKGRTSGARVAVQETTGTLTDFKTSTFFELNDFDPGETLYVFIEATSGDLIPTIVLWDFGDKPIRSGNLSGEQSRARLEYTFEEKGSNYALNIASCCGDKRVTTGDFRLLVGVNAPQVLTGEAANQGQPIIRAPTEVQAGIILQQIVGVDQRSENFSVVARLQMEWTDPALAFSPDTCRCSFKSFTGDSFSQFIIDTKGRWPEFTLFNQQGNRWIQNQVVIVTPDGHALYVERFSVTLQAPDFDFTRFPFDTQQFFIRIDSIFPEEFYVYRDLEGFSGLSEQLGEEEWKVTAFETAVSTVIRPDALSRFSFRFQANRNLTFYIIRIFVPLLLIITVAWITFFLKEYARRIEVTSANLLLFIAFNFTISDNLPRLGYLTYLDVILVSTFIIGVLVVAFNVYLRRLKVDGKEALARSRDRYMIWVYPALYFGAFTAVTVIFFWL